jgi:hypothetical protein
VLSDQYGFDAYPWDRQDGETSNNYAAFITYRDLGARRSLRKASCLFYNIPEDQFDPMGAKIRTLAKWSSKFRWVARVEEYDDWMQKLEDAEDIEAIKAMRKRHVQLTTVVQSKIVTYLNGLDERTIQRMNPDQAMRMLDLAIKNERLARGVPDAITGLTDAKGGPVEVEHISEDALERKFAAFMQAHDPENTIEKGEPEGPDQESDDILAEALEQHDPLPAPWPSDEDEPFPDTGADEPDDDESV